jgi:glycyl-tRNA synthetase beta subunit
VVFQERLGTLFDKTQRVADLAVYIAGKIGLDPKLAAGPASSARPT